jgi:hypothetical protein
VAEPGSIPPELVRTSPYLAHPVFNKHHSETELMRYLQRLASRDLSLTTSMIPLGSCTMKLNAAAEMLPVTWPEVGQMHPFAPGDQAKGYMEMFEQLEEWLSEATGFAAWYARTSKRQTGGAFGQPTPGANVLINQRQGFETQGLDVRLRRDFDAFGSLQSATFGALWFNSDAPVRVDKGASAIDVTGSAGALARTAIGGAMFELVQHEITVGGH